MKPKTTMAYITLRIVSLSLLVMSTVESFEVLTTTGKVRGKYNLGSKPYYSFEGIRYAESPTGDLRFKPPVPAKAWAHVLDATQPSPVCPQPEILFTYDQMDEDCLFVNIFTPTAKTDAGLPVFVYVPGGYFALGSGNVEPILGPQIIMEYNIVLVTFNYRLGILGFLSLGIEEASGNAGIKDTLLALKWIKKNIKKFGGDPNKITAGGTGAAAMIINFLMLNKEANGLFQRAILFSGTALSYRAIQNDPKYYATDLARRLGIKSNDEYVILQKLKETNATELSEIELLMADEVPNKAFVYITQFIPCIEANTTSAIIKIDPIEATKAGLTVNIPVLLGMTNQEGLNIFPIINDEALQSYPNRINYLNENFESCIPTNIDYPYGSPQRQELARDIREFYFNGANISIVTTQNYVNLLSDTAFVYPIDYWIKLQQNLDYGAPIYYYLIEFDSKVNWFKAAFNITYPGTAHADDVGFYFIPEVTKSKYKTLDARKQASLNVIRSYIFNFIICGNPSPPGSLYPKVKWTNAGLKHAHIVLGDKARMESHAPYTKRLKFWYRVYKEYDQYKANIEDFC